MNTNITKKIKIWQLLVAVILVVGGAGAIALTLGNSQPSDNSSSRLEEQQPAQFVDYVTYMGQKDKSALSQLKETTKNVATKASTYGEYVDSIGTQKGGTDGKYWSFYVDGKLSDVGAAAFIAKGGEKIEWKFEKLQ